MNNLSGIDGANSMRFHTIFEMAPASKIGIHPNGSFGDYTSSLPLSHAFGEPEKMT